MIAVVAQAVRFVEPLVKKEQPVVCENHQRLGPLASENVKGATNDGRPAIVAPHVLA